MVIPVFPPYVLQYGHKAIPLSTEECCVQAVKARVQSLGRRLLQDNTSANDSSSTTSGTISATDAAQLTQEDLCILQTVVQQFSDNSYAPLGLMKLGTFTETLS
jgi:hypothetical protein